MYLSGNITNEIYTLKEMRQQPDRHYFEEVMREEVKAMFDNEIWEQVSCQYNYYIDLRNDGQDVKRERIMMIWSFKQKRYPCGKIRKYKARLCCRGG